LAASGRLLLLYQWRVLLLLIDRVLDPNNDDVTVATLRKAAEAVGQRLKLELELVAA
jgi:3-hydroxymyristoyl/3-hydroxydecanoyl-(acyl carrier protein) dehydratase